MQFHKNFITQKIPLRVLNYINVQRIDVEYISVNYSHIYDIEFSWLNKTRRPKLRSWIANAVILDWEEFYLFCSAPLETPVTKSLD